MSKLNKRGFTLVELLSVIVILSVVVLIATNAVVPAMNSARKQVLATEANTIRPFAEKLYVESGGSGTKCFTFDQILEAGLEKNDEKYTGSVSVSENENGKYSYKIWLSNGTVMIDGKNVEVTPEDVIMSAEDASTVCGVVSE